jgi:iron complex outermembrane receptor protein
MPAAPAVRLRVQKPDFAFVSRNPSFMKKYAIAVVFTVAVSVVHGATSRSNRPAPADTLVPVQLNAVRVVPVSFISQSFVSSDRLLSSAPLAIAQLAQIQPGFHVQNIGNHTIKPVFRGLGGNRILTVYQGFRYDNQQGGGDHGLDLPLLGTSAIQLQPSLELGTEGVGGALIVHDLPLWGGLSRRLTQGQLAGLAQPWGMEAGFEHQNTGSDVARPFYAGVLWTQQGDYRDANGDTVHGTHARTASFRYLQGFAGPSGRSTVSLTHTDRFFGIPTSETATLPGHEHHEHEQQVQNTALTWKWDQNESKEETAEQGNKRPRMHHSVGYIRANRLELGEEGLEHPELAFAIHSLQHLTRASWRTTQVSLHNQFRALQNNPKAHEQTYPNSSIWSTALTVQQQIVKSNRWDLHAATRFETGTFTLFGSSLRAEYRAAKQWTLLAEVHEASRAPQLEERFADGLHVGVGRYEVGNPDLREENGLHANLGVRRSLRFGGNLEGGVQAFAYAKSFRNYILTTPSDTSGTLKFYYVQDDAFLLGADLQVFMRYEHWAGLTNRIIHDAQIQASALQGSRGSAWQRTDVALPAMPPYRLTGTYTGTLKSMGQESWFWTAETQTYADQTRLSADEKSVWNAERTPGFTVLNAGIGRKWEGPGYARYSLEFRVLNATNALYAHHLSYVRALGLYEPGRQYRLRLTFAF